MCSHLFQYPLGYHPSCVIPTIISLICIYHILVIPFISLPKVNLFTSLRVFETNWSAISLHTCCSKITTSNFSRSILHNNKPLVSTLIFSKVSHEMKKKKKQIIKIKSKSISHNNKPIVSTLIFPSLVIR